MGCMARCNSPISSKQTQTTFTYLQLHSDLVQYTGFPFPKKLSTPSRNTLHHCAKRSARVRLIRTALVLVGGQRTPPACLSGGYAYGRRTSMWMRIGNAVAGSGQLAAMQAGRQTPSPTPMPTKCLPVLVSQRPWNVNGIQNVAGGGTWTAARREGTGCQVQNQSRTNRKKSSTN